MTLFSIQCATCQATLNVRDPALIGQILACPKCSSMVLVEAPEGFEPPVEAPATQTADSDDSDATGSSTVSANAEDANSQGDRGAAKVADKPATGRDGKPRQGKNGGKRSGRQTMSIQPVTTKDGEKAPAPHPHYDSRADTKPMAMPEPHELAEQKPILPSADWSSSESQQMRKILLLSGIGVGVVVIAVAFCGFWLAKSRSVADAEPTENGAATNADAPENGQPTVPTNPNEANPNEASPTEPEVGGETPIGAEPGGEANRKPGEGPDPTQPVIAGPDGATPEKSATSTGAEQPGDREDPMAEPAAPNATGNSGDNPFEPGATKTGNDKTNAEEDAAAITESLRKLEALLSPGGAEEEGPRESPLNAIKPTIELTPKPSVRNVDIKVQLKRPVQSIEFSDVPLISFVRFVSEMSTIPISIDPLALRARNLTTMTPITVNQKETTVERLLTNVLSTHNLTLRPGKNHLRIELPDEGPARLDVADLLDDDSVQIERVATWVTSLVAPQTWSGVGGDGGLAVEGRSLVIDSHPNIIFETKRFLDRIRIARGLPAKFGVDESQLRLELNAQPAKLAQPVTANFRIPAYFTDVLAHLANQADVELLVDWGAAAQAGWNQEGRVRLSVENERLDKALEKLLAPMELSYRMLDARTIQIVTPAMAGAANDIYFHPSRDALQILNNDEQALQTLMQASLGAKRFGPQGGVIQAYVDPISKRLMTLAPVSEHQAILKLLSQIGSRESPTPKP